MKIGMLKNEITAKKVNENEDGIGGGGDSDEETNTMKYETGNKKRKGDEDDEQESENEDKEEEDSEQERTYDDIYQKTDDEDETIINENEENEEKEDEEEINTNTEEITANDNIGGSDNETNENEENKKKSKNKIKNVQKDILERKKYIYNNITIDNMKFSSSKEESSSTFYFDLFIPYAQKNILLKNILNLVLKKINFKSVKNIKKCHLLDKDTKSGKEYSIQLEGFNFDEVAKYSDLVDINHISTNDIGGVLSIYGIEACRSAIVKEIVNVFDVYSIKVNKRHLGLIADYITFQGKYRSFSRVGISYVSSPMLKMTYETTLQFLMEACETKSIDKGNTPSSRIMLGQPPKCGTGAFDIFQK